MTVILGTWKAEIRKITVQSQSMQNFWETPISTNCWVQWLESVIPSNARNCDQDNHSSRTDGAKKFVRPHLNGKKAGHGIIPAMVRNLR
jgi:hypothetical protein